MVATVAQGDGSRATRVFKPNVAAPIDCFYVYPTVSEDPAGNSGMMGGPGEKRAVAQQFAAFASVCRPFAPIYRQVTLAGVEAVLRHQPLPVDFKLPYKDVRAAWRHYLAHDNDGRGVVLIGHSQGARILARLIAHEIEGKPEQRLLAGALILGFNVEVPEGKDVGGTFKTIPLCRAAGQSGCVVAYETFPANAPPPDNSRFAHPETPAMEIACTDPAALAGGKLDPILATETNLLGKPPLDASWAAFVKPLDAPFVSLPGNRVRPLRRGAEGFLPFRLDQRAGGAGRLAGDPPRRPRCGRAAPQELGLAPHRRQCRDGQPHRLRLDAAQAGP